MAAMRAVIAAAFQGGRKRRIFFAKKPTEVGDICEDERASRPRLNTVSFEILKKDSEKLLVFQKRPVINI
jgi:hypothetical protein